MMTRNVIVWMNYYFDILRDVNKELIKIVGMDCVGNIMDIEQTFCELMSKIVVLVPYTLDRKENKTKLSLNDGILSFRQEFNCLENGFNDLINENLKTFQNIKLVRNKYEHEAHFVNTYYALSGSAEKTNISLKYNNHKETNIAIEISSDDLIKIMKRVNLLYDDMMEQVLDFLDKDCNDENFRYVYQNKYWRKKYSEYNEIYESPLLLKISRAMN